MFIRREAPLRLAPVKVVIVKVVIEEAAEKVALVAAAVRSVRPEVWVVQWAAAVARDAAEAVFPAWVREASAAAAPRLRSVTT